MSSAAYHPSTSRRRRALALVLALAIELIIALALFSLGAFEPKKPKVEPKLEVFDVRPTLSSKKAAAREKTKKTTKQASAPAPTVPPPPLKPTNPRAAELGPPQMIVLDRDQFAKSDIGKMASDDGDDDSGAGSGNSKAAYGPGQGPGGQPIFDVAWYREPTHGELAGYLPRGAPPDSYALIACRMVENYHVENCQALGESPPGSGLARAMRQAAWQFLVRPPRVGNKVKLGAWVRIRIEFNKVAG